MFITTNLRLAGGYHLPSAVDVVFGGGKKSEQYFIIHFIFIKEKLGDKKYEWLKDQE